MATCALGRSWCELGMSLHNGTECVGVDLVEGRDDRDRRTVTWHVYLDGALLGHAFSEREGHQWIADMRRMQSATTSAVGTP